MNMKKINYNAIDIAKLIASIIVIFVHTYPFYEAFPTIGFISSNILGRMVVPFFLVVSGFFFEQYFNYDKTKYTNYLNKLIKLYLFWSLIALPSGYLFAMQYFSINPFSILAGIAIGLLYTGIYYHLWYMPALIFAIIFYHKVYNKIKLNYLLIIFFILYIIGLSETYFELVSLTALKPIFDTYFSIFFTTRNAIFFTTFFFLLGVKIYQSKVYLNKKNVSVKLILSLTFLIIEAFSVRHFKLAIDYNMYLMMIPFQYYFIVFLLNLNIKFNLNYQSIRKYSTLFYFSHGIFLEFFINFTPVLYENGLYRITSVLTCTIIVSYICKKKFKFLY